MDGAFDWVRLRIDLASDPAYQPLEYAGIDRIGMREAGSLTRWEAMRPVVDEVSPKTAVDLGCNFGWFGLKLASRGILTVGVETYPAFYRTALYSARKSGLANFCVLTLEIAPGTVKVLPEGDCTVLLSLWHHLVRDYGFDSASEMLNAIWRRTGDVLFFDTGESEMPASYGLPDMQPDSRTWLEGYLGDVCDGATVQHLGQHHGGWQDDRPVYRHLFAVRR